MLEYLAYGQALIQNANEVKAIIDEAISNDDITTKVKNILGPAANLLEKEGAAFFPKAAPALHLAAAVMATFDPTMTKWVQRALNRLVTPSPNLVIDGKYGPRTKAAVEALQAGIGLTVDGWAGQITQSAIAKVLGGK